MAGCVASCFSCGTVTSRGLCGSRQDFVEDEFEGDREGTFDTCAECGSIDVDIFTPEGWAIEERAAAVLAAQKAS